MLWFVILSILALAILAMLPAECTPRRRGARGGFFMGNCPCCDPCPQLTCGCASGTVPVTIEVTIPELHKNDIANYPFLSDPGTCTACEETFPGTYVLDLLESDWNNGCTTVTAGACVWYLDTELECDHEGRTYRLHIVAHIGPGMADLSGNNGIRVRLVFVCSTCNMVGTMQYRYVFGDDCSQVACTPQTMTVPYHTFLDGGGGLHAAPCYAYEIGDSGGFGPLEVVT